MHAIMLIRMHAKFANTHEHMHARAYGHNVQMQRYKKHTCMKARKDT